MQMLCKHMNIILVTRKSFNESLKFTKKKIKLNLVLAVKDAINNAKAP